MLSTTKQFLINLIIFTSLLGAACSPSRQAVAPPTARQILTDAWRAGQHITWEINWPAAPVGGPLTVETWRAGNRYRFEILEAVAPALKGELLVFDGQDAWRYNRFEPPATFSPISPSLSPSLPPVSELFLMIDQLLETPAQAANQETVRINARPAQKIELIFAGDDHLSLWKDHQTNLPVRISFSIAGEQATLHARSFEPLINPPDALFSVGMWAQNAR